MKPPLRPRLAPARFVTSPGAAAGPERGPGGDQRPGAAWSGREKRSLLAALRAQAGRQLPELKLLREKLPRRSEEEILRFLSRLRGRAAREAVSTRYRHCLEQQRRRRAQIPAPIEVWLELAEALAESLEEASAAAFSQVLTVAATEPLSLHHSKPPQPLVLPEPGGAAAGSPPETPQEPQGTSQEPPEDPSRDFTVSFPKIYEFLAQLCRGGKGPQLPPAESAVVLALLSCLPQEVQGLDLVPLQSHFRGSYSDLTTPCPLGLDPSDPPETPPAPETPPPAPRTPSEEGWKGVGLCPLNLFLVPLRLLARGGTSG